MATVSPEQFKSGLKTCGPMYEKILRSSYEKTYHRTILR